MSGRLSRKDAVLLVIDVQERLVPTIDGHAALVRRTDALLQAARWFGVACRATEHCPAQLGLLLDSLRKRFAPDEIRAKAAFGAAEEKGFVEWLRASGRRQIVVTGMEAHVCVLQTVLGLRQAGFEVFVAADAVGSRVPRQADRGWALERMVAAGAVLASTETILFEWAQRADDARFRDGLGLVKSL